MNSEARLVTEIWDLMRDHIPSARRGDAAINLLRAFEDYGIEPVDLADLLEEDRHLARAYLDLYETEDDEEPVDEDE